MYAIRVNQNMETGQVSSWTQSVHSDSNLTSFFIEVKMKKIELTQGQVALVDDEDFEQLNKFKWCALWARNTKSFYAVRGSKTKDGKWHTISMNREILGLKRDDKRQGDHRNHDTLDNQRSNLRVVTCQQNHFNRKDSKGYYWNKAAKKYRAQIMVNGKHIHLGYFLTTKDARNAYLQAKKQYHII